jgi:signal transduction histidine kinase
MEEGTLPPSAERIAIIKAEVDQLNRLVTDLRTLALADAGQLSIEKAPVKPSALFLRLKSAFELLAKQKQIDLVFETAPNLSPLLVDEGRMVQALSNLLSNALRHTPEGGRITLSAIQDADAIQLIVEDTGEGIPPESLDRMFERFYRVDDSRFASKGETGLGLSIVKAIIEAHSGKVTVHSQIGTGTTFTLILPRAITS